MSAEPNEIQQPTCFIIAPIGEPDSEIRKQSDQVLRHLIDPACAVIQHMPLRADSIHAAGHITTQMLELILSAPLAIADLSGLNPNVMYEIGVRHMIGKPVAQIALYGTELPFDVGALRTVFFDMKNPDDLERARHELQEQLLFLVQEPNQDWSFAPGLNRMICKLDDEQTRSIIRLHQASAGFRIYRVIDDTVSMIENDLSLFDPESFFMEIRTALLESRRLCASFFSRRLGNLYEFYCAHYADEELRVVVEGGQRIVLDEKLDSNTKRKRLLSYLHRQEVNPS